MTADPKTPAGRAPTATLKSTVVEVRGLHWSTSRAIVEHVLLQRPEVAAVDANPVAQTATVSYDPSVTSDVRMGAGSRFQVLWRAATPTCSRWTGNATPDAEATAAARRTAAPLRNSGVEVESPILLDMGRPGDESPCQTCGEAEHHDQKR